ncbi:MAG: protein tyrosine phosphatase family protein, partial [Limisphaerales bacterium]
MSAEGLAGIDNYLEIDDSLGTAGQPTIEQFDLLQDAGFETVINLALPTSDNAIANEGSIVTGHGQRYVHIPVDFAAPRNQDFHLFTAIMDECRDQKV